MRIAHKTLFLLGSLLILSSSYACLGSSTVGQCPRQCKKETCCSGMGGVSYCDSSAGRYVCNNGDYSTCYCTRHAIMDLQQIQGCCLWQGGVLATTPKGVVLCNDGGISEVCSLQERAEPVSQF